MWRQVVGTVTVFCLGIGIVLAGETRAIITKVDGDKVTFAENKGKGEKGEEKTLPVAANVKVTKGTYNRETKKVENPVAVEGGIKSEQFTKINEKGLNATIVTDDDNKKIIEIRITGGRRKKD